MSEWDNDLRAADAVRLAEVLDDLRRVRLPTEEQLSTAGARFALAVLTDLLEEARRVCRVLPSAANDNDNDNHSHTGEQP